MKYTLFWLVTFAATVPVQADMPAKIEAGAERVGTLVGTGARAVVTTPLKAFNVNKTKVPPLLEKTLLNPYALSGTSSCAEIAVSVRALDAVLGVDVDVALRPGHKISATEVSTEAGKAVVGSFIPGLGIIRQISGAAAAERHARAAVNGGAVRRGFLKGLGLARGCKAPAAPRVVQ